MSVCSVLLTPREFIEAEKKKYAPRTQPQLDKLPKWLTEHVKANPELAEQLSRQFDNDYALLLLETLVPRMSAQFVCVLESDLVAIAELNDSEPNARCTPLGAKGFAVTFNSGLRDLNYRVIRALSTRFVFGEDVEESISFEDTCKIVGEIFVWAAEIGIANGPDYRVTDEQVYLANILTLEVNAFFLAHELAHGAIHLGKQMTGNDVFDLGELEEEHVADVGAVAALLSRPDFESGLPPIEISYAAIEIAFSIWTGLERFGIPFESETHPRPEERLEFIRHYVSDQLSTRERQVAVTSFSRTITEVFENVLEPLTEEKYQNWLDKVSIRLLDELDMLLDQCSGGLTPDYARFYEGASRIFQSGISIKLSERMLEVSNTFHELLGDSQKSAADMSAAEAQQAVKAFHKYKLFYGLIQNFDPKVKEVFERALAFEN